jgi:hypothetical protein
VGDPAGGAALGERFLMIVNASTPASGGPARILVLKKWYKIQIQVTGPNTVFLGTSKDEAGRTNNGVQQDGLQLNNVSTSGNNPPYQCWWIGELWASGSADGTQFVIIIPGLSPEIYQAGGGANCDPEE